MKLIILFCVTIRFKFDLIIKKDRDLKIIDAHFHLNMQIIYESSHKLKHNFVFFFEVFTLKFLLSQKIGFVTNFWINEYTEFVNIFLLKWCRIIFSCITYFSILKEDTSYKRSFKTSCLPIWNQLTFVFLLLFSWCTNLFTDFCRILKSLKLLQIENRNVVFFFSYFQLILLNIT